MLAKSCLIAAGRGSPDSPLERVSRRLVKWAGAPLKLENATLLFLTCSSNSSVYPGEVRGGVFVARSVKRGKRDINCCSLAGPCVTRSRCRPAEEASSAVGEMIVLPSNQPAECAKARLDFRKRSGIVRK